MDSQSQPTEITCPQCGARLRIQLPVGEPVDVVCPKCGAEFPSEKVAAPEQSAEEEKPGGDTHSEAAGKLQMPSPRRNAARKTPEPEEPVDEEPGDEEPETEQQFPEAPEERRERKAKPNVMPVSAGEPAESRGDGGKSNVARGIWVALIIVLVLVLGLGVAWFFVTQADDDVPVMVEADADATAEEGAGPSAASDPLPGNTAQPAPLEEAAQAAAEAGSDPVVLQDPSRQAPIVTPDSPVDAVAETSPVPVDLDTVLSGKAPERKNWQKAAALGKIFLESPSWQEMTNYVRAPEQVIPLMRNYYGQNTYKPRIVDSITKLQLAETEDGTPMAFLVLQTDDYALAPMTLEMVNGEFKVDWESYVGLQGMDWNEFRRERPREPVEFRVGIASAGNLGVTGLLKGDFHAFRLIRQTGLPLVAYIPKLHEDAGELFTMVQDGEATDVILALKYAEDATGSEHVEITELVQKGWVRDYDQVNALENDSEQEGAESSE